MNVPAKLRSGGRGCFVPISAMFIDRLGDKASTANLSVSFACG
jgi:hypothetical protein